MRTNNATRLANAISPTQYRRPLDRLTLVEWTGIVSAILGLPVESDDAQTVALGVMRHYAGDHTPMCDCLDSVYWDIVLTHQEGYHFGSDLLRNADNWEKCAGTSDHRLREGIGKEVSTDAMHEAQRARTDSEDVKYDNDKLAGRRHLPVYKDTWSSYDPFPWLAD